MDNLLLVLHENLLIAGLEQSENQIGEAVEDVIEVQVVVFAHLVGLIVAIFE